MTPSPPPARGRLYVVATPIGCLEDITLRALRILAEVDLVLAEDTRRTGILLQHHGITTQRRSFHAHSSADQASAFVDRLHGGERFALVSDAGTPLISDPGGGLVRAAVAAGVPVESIPGPSAVLAALTVAGLPAPGFTFRGFLPRSGRRRRGAVQALLADPLPTALYESPNRTHATLKELANAAEPERQAAVCRELTKMHEEVWRGTLTELASRAESGVRGEVTIIISGADAREASGEEVGPGIIEMVTALLNQGASTRDVAHLLANASGLTRKAAYRTVLDLVDQEAKTEG